MKKKSPYLYLFLFLVFTGFGAVAYAQSSGMTIILDKFKSNVDSLKFGQRTFEALPISAAKKDENALLSREFNRLLGVLMNSNVPVGQGCSNGFLISGFNPDGSIVCRSITAGFRQQAANESFRNILRDQLAKGDVKLKIFPSGDVSTTPVVKGKQTGDVLSAGEFNRLLQVLGDNLKLLGRECPTGRALRSINADGSFNCSKFSGAGSQRIAFGENQLAKDLFGKLGGGFNYIASPAATAAAELSIAQEELGVAEVNLAARKAELSRAEDNVSAGQRELSIAESNLATAESELRTAEVNLLTGQTELSTAEGNLSTGEAELATAETNLFDGQRELSIAESNLTTAETKFAIADSNLSTAETALAGIEADFVTAESELSTIEYNLGLLQTEFTNAELDLSSAEAALATAEADLSAEDFAAVEEGLRNAVIDFTTIRDAKNRDINDLTVDRDTKITVIQGIVSDRSDKNNDIQDLSTERDEKNRDVQDLTAERDAKAQDTEALKTIRDAKIAEVQGLIVIQDEKIENVQDLTVERASKSNIVEDLKRAESRAIKNLEDLIVERGNASGAVTLAEEILAGSRGELADAISVVATVGPVLPGEVSQEGSITGIRAGKLLGDNLPSSQFNRLLELLLLSENMIDSSCDANHVMTGFDSEGFIKCDYGLPVYRNQCVTGPPVNLATTESYACQKSFSSYRTEYFSCSADETCSQIKVVTESIPSTCYRQGTTSVPGPTTCSLVCVNNCGN